MSKLRENTNSLSRSRYTAINMIIKRQVMIQSDTKITVRVMMGGCNAVDEINVIREYRGLLHIDSTTHFLILITNCQSLAHLHKLFKNC
jgi:hypothetical protein